MKQRDRREILTRVGVVVAGTVTVAGCVTSRNTTNDESEESVSTDTTSPDPSESSATTDSDADSQRETSEQTQLSVTDTTLEHQSVCQEPAATFETDSLTVAGCVTGSTGCHEPVVKQTTTEGSTVELTVESVDTSSEETVCTSVVTETGYRVTIRTAGPPPKAVTIVHDDMTGKRTVMTAER